MRRVALTSQPSGTPEQQLRWVVEAVRELAQASEESDPAEIAKNFAITGPYTTTRTLDAATPNLANIVAVFATFLDDLKKGGANRTV